MGALVSPELLREKGQPAMLLDQFISQTGRQPENWTSQDIQNYLEYVKTHAGDGVASKRAVAQTDFVLRQAQHERKKFMISRPDRSP
jgi:hypothetical protein